LYIPGENWSVTLREEYRLRVFENRMLRKICRLMREEITGDLRKFRNAELHDLESIPNIIWVIKSGRMR
jgi:hypothetical protein